MAPVVPDLHEYLKRFDVTSTAKSFSSWDTCMDNKTCKIVAIVGICIASFVLLWFVFAILSCLCMGKQILEGCCCCCAPTRKVYVEQRPQTAYDNPHMYPPTPAPAMYQLAPAPAHFANQYNGYQPVQREMHDDENPFEDRKYHDYR